MAFKDRYGPGVPSDSTKAKKYNPKYDFAAMSDSIRASEKRATDEYSKTGKRGKEYSKYQQRLNDYTVQMAGRDSAQGADRMKAIRAAEKRGRANDLEGGELTNIVDYLNPPAKAKKKSSR